MYGAGIEACFLAYYVGQLDNIQKMLPIIIEICQVTFSKIISTIVISANRLIYGTNCAIIHNSLLRNLEDCVRMT